MVCGGESIAATNTGDVNLIYQVGATESIANAMTLFSSYFTKTITGATDALVSTVTVLSLTKVAMSVVPGIITVPDQPLVSPTSL